MASHKKILFMDDDGLFRDSLSQLLMLKGYQIIEADSVRTAEKILQEQWVHMVIVDLNFSPDDTQDRSGLQIVDNPAFRSVIKVILTGHGEDPALVRKTLRPNQDGIPSVVDFISKGDEDVLASVCEAFETSTGVNWDLEIQWRSSTLASIIALAGLVVPNEQRRFLAYRMDELEDLLCRLFVDYQRLNIGRLLTHNGGIALFEVFAQNEKGEQSEYIVACGQSCLMRQQMDNYESYAPKRNLVGNVRLADAVESVHFVVLTYECIGANLTQVSSLQDLYVHRSVEEIKPILSKFLSDPLRMWHEQKRTMQTVATLQQLYQLWSGVELDTRMVKTLMASVAALSAQAAKLQGIMSINDTSEQLAVYMDEMDELTFSHPISFLSESDVLLGVAIPVANVLGQLALSDILADVDDGSAWLIEFSGARRGPILFDYIAMEFALKAELLSAIDIRSWSILARQLIGVHSLDEPIDIEGWSAEVQKILYLIMTVREQAIQSGNPDLNMYRAGLCVYALTQLAAYDPAESYIQQDIALHVSHLLTAALACESLVSKREFLPDFDDKIVIVEGRPIADLTKQEWQILEFLYAHKGQLCTFEEMLRSVYEDDIDDISNGAWLRESGRPKVNAAIRRLRRKLEPNPQSPRYIFTEREHGYRLTV